VAVVEDVSAHLGKLLATVDVQRLALFVGGAAVAFGVEQDGVVLGGREAVSLPFDDALEGGGSPGKVRSTRPILAACAVPTGRQSLVRAAAVRCCIRWAPTSRNGYREQQIRPDPAEQSVLMMQDFDTPAE